MRVVTLGLPLPLLLLILGVSTLACKPSPKARGPLPMQGTGTLPIPTSNQDSDIDEANSEGRARKSLGSRLFSNPIVDTGADPWVIQEGGRYLRTYSDGDSSIWVTTFSNLDEMRQEISVNVWKSPPGTLYSKQVWAPELHFLDNRWYIYFAASDGDNVNHRIYVLESESEDPQGKYIFKGKIAAPTDRWAIDGTVMVTDDGKRYFIWSGWDGGRDIQQNLYIAPMLNPWTIAPPTYTAQRHEAEAARITQARTRSSPEASAGQAAGNIDFVDSSIEFQLSLARAGTYVVDVHYSNGTQDESSHQLSVNSQAPLTVRYPSTTQWENWQTVSLLVNLQAGSNSLRFVKGMSFAELDYIEIKVPGSDRIVIGGPKEAWEKRAAAINEGPVVLKRNDKIHLIYSASGSWTDDYTLGMLSLEGQNPLDPKAWVRRGQVFARSEKVFGPGHCSFTKSPDKSEDWIVYHAAKTRGSGWDRNIRAQKFTWDSEGLPVFGIPVEPGLPIAAPSFFLPDP